MPRTLIGFFVLLNSNIFELLCFIVPSHIALVFFLFSFKPETVPNHSIVWRCDLRESVLLVIIDYYLVNTNTKAKSANKQSCNKLVYQFSLYGQKHKISSGGWWEERESCTKFHLEKASYSTELVLIVERVVNIKSCEI